MRKKCILLKSSFRPLAAVCAGAATCTGTQLSRRRAKAKSRSRFIWSTLRSLSAAGVLVLATEQSFAQGWYTVDDFQYSPGIGSFAYGMARDPSRATLYAAGGGGAHALAFKSS